MITQKGTHFILIRHGESHSNGQNRIQGHSDSGLTERGLRQARRVAKRLAGLKIKKVYSSDLGRALSTANIISKHVKKPIITCDLLREISLGEWEGLTTDDVNKKYKNGYFKWLSSPSKMKIPGAEKIVSFHRRVRNRVENIMEKEKRGPVALVTHGGVIASLLSHWLDSDFDKTLLNLRIDNTSITHIEKNPSRIKIHLLNDVSHLRESDLSSKNIFTCR